MATAGQAETPTSKSSLVNNCDNSSSSGGANNSKLVNGSGVDPDYNSQENNNAMKEGYRGYNQNHHVPPSSTYDHHHNRVNHNNEQKGGGNSMDGPPEYPPPPHHQQQYQYPPYRPQGYEQHPPPPPHHNNGPDSYQQQHPPGGGYPPPMRYPGKPMPVAGGGAGSVPPPPHGYPPPPGPGGVRPGYPPPPGQSISQQPSGQTPTLNQLLQSPGGANTGASGAAGGQRYPPPPPGSYEHGYPPPTTPHSKADYSQGPTGWPPAGRPPANSYVHPPPPPGAFQQQQPVYRPGTPGAGSRGGPPPQPPSGQPPQPHQSYYQHHQQGPPVHHPGYPPPPPQSPHYPPPHSQRYPSPGPGMRPHDNQPTSHYPPQHPPNMPPPESSGPELPKSTPPPPPSPSLGSTHSQNPPSPQQSPRSTPHPPPVSSANSLPPPNSPSHNRPLGSSPSYPPPDVGEVTGTNSNDSVGGALPNQPGGPRPSPSPTGSAGSRSMSPAVGNQNIPMPPRPSSSQSDGSNNPPRMSPMPSQGGSYPGQPMAPPSHLVYQSGGKMPHQQPGGMVPPPSGQSMYPHHQGNPPQQPWQSQHGQLPQQGAYGARGPLPQHSHLMSPYPPPPGHQPMQGSGYGGPRHSVVPNHVGGPPPPHGPPGGNQYSPYPSPHYPPPSQPGSWQSPPGTPPTPRSQLHLKQQLQHKMGYPPPPHGYGMGPPGPMSSPSQTPPPSHPPQLHGGTSDSSHDGGNANPPNLISVGPDGANVDELSQQSTLSNASGTSGGDDGPPMPRLKPEGARPPHQNYPNHPTTPQNNAVPSPGAASMNSAAEEYGEMNSPGWPRTPVSPGLNSHPPPPSEHFKGKNKKADSLNKMYEMDDNPERRIFLDKLIHFMEENNSPITACPTISKNPLDLFRLYLFVKERGGFIEVSKNKTWKDIAGMLGIGASSSAAYTLRKHYTKHLFPFECKYDRGGIDPQPLINQVETSAKKKGKTAAPIPSPGSSNSQDSFPGPNNNTNSSSMDGYSSSSSNYPSYGQPPTGSEYGPNAPSPAQSPLSRPPPGPPGQNQNSQALPSQHPGDKAQISVSNPFDDQYPQLYHQQSRTNFYLPYSSQPLSGYQGSSGSYPPYSQGEQYPGRTQVPPHEGYPGQPYGRPPYSPYGENSAPMPHTSPYPHPSQPPTSQAPPQSAVPPTSQASAPTPEDRYNMAPPASQGVPPPTPGGYPPRPGYPGPQQGPPPTAVAPSSVPPPNGYPNQDYYSSQSPNDQAYQLGGKHVPPPVQPNQPIRYPPTPGKEGPYPGGFPSATGSPQRPPFEAQPGGRAGYVQPRSSPSPSPNTPAQPSAAPAQKNWSNSEGWLNSGSPYPGQQQPSRGYPGPQPSASPHTPPQGSTPAPAQSPGATTPTPPQQAISPQPWGPGRSGPTPASNAQGPPAPPPGASWPQQDGRYNQPPASIMSPPAASVPAPHGPVQPPWTPPSGSQSRSSTGRPPFPGGKPIGPEMFRSYGPSPSLQSPASQMKGALSASPVPPSVIAPSYPPVQPSMSAPGVVNKRDIVFPQDSVEAVTPVLSRRRKLHKADVSPIEAWRIMMSLKSGLLAEVTWALDVLNVLLYDDHSVSYFSLAYLPGLLDILLEHLRRALVLTFGTAVGLDINGDKSEDSKNGNDKLAWYERKKSAELTEPDMGTPILAFPRDGYRTLIMQTPLNYTMVSRRGGRKVRIVSRDDEPFIVSGIRNWDVDEKSRNDPDVEPLLDTLESTKHIVTYFSTDLPVPLPIVRDMKAEEERKNEFNDGSDATSKSNDLNLELYRCETKLPIIEPTNVPSSSAPSNSSVIAPISTTPNTKKLENGPMTPEKLEDSANIEKKNCRLFATPLSSNSVLQSSKVNNSVIQKKAKRLDDLLGRIRRDHGEDDNARSELLTQPTNEDVKPVIVKQENVEPPPPPAIVENGLSDTADNSNLSAANSENTCDSNKPQIKNTEKRIGDLNVRDPGCTLKRKRMEDYEDECYTQDESSLYLVTESQDYLARRCLSICNIIRSLTFVPGNEAEFGKCAPFLSLVGKLILLHHDHPVKKPKAERVKLSTTNDKSQSKDDISEENQNSEQESGQQTQDKPEDNGEMKSEEEDEPLFAEDVASAASEIEADSCTSLINDEEWWWDYVHHIREHVLVMLANIAGQMDLSQFSEEISRPILDGLLHWAVCPAAYGQDPFPTINPISSLSPQRLALEALVKLSVIQGNVDLILATPPYSRIERLCQQLCRSLCRTEEQVMREFALNLLYYLSAADSGVARSIALQNPCISLLISFIEQAEHNAMQIANNHGFSVLRDNPEAMGTSLDMLRRAAMTLLNLARHPDNRPLFVQHEPRLLQLVMSQILEQKVAAMVAQVLYQCSTPDAICSQKYLYASNMDTFYTPLFSRSRSHQLPQSHLS